MRSLLYYVFCPHLLTAENVARGKPTIQSSTSYEGKSEYAVDGRRDTDYRRKSCTHTFNGVADPFWAVHLGDKYLVSHVNITNRADCCGE